MKRPIRALELGDTKPNEIVSVLPEVRMVNPSELLVDDAYQRGLSEKSIKLIERIVANWDWRRFKPPIVAETFGGYGYEVIDGQHTAIAAASHPDISEIPVMVVVATDQADRAMAFVGHNRDRLGITRQHIHYAAVAAGDEDALTIEQVCQKAGVRIIRVPPAGGRAYQSGDTMAVDAVSALVKRRYAMGARIVLSVLAGAGCAPVRADQIKAVDYLLNDRDYAGLYDPEALTETLKRFAPDEVETEAQAFAFGQKLPKWRGIAAFLARHTKKQKRPEVNGGGQ